jgi:predicted component of type VI protein secretion system
MSKKNVEATEQTVSEKKRLTPDQVEKQINAVKKIVEYTEQIKTLLSEFEGKSVNLAYANSVMNLEKKNEKYGTARAPALSDEEKELLKKFRAGEIIIKEKKV